ncbi:MAG: response regulator [Xenococcaceae cyanobacterium MO_188.B32]|nr:response regulator [Xenococcaceae cyanobacterium MO_188.B32]
MTQDVVKREKLRILIVDDHELILRGTIEALRKHYPTAEIRTAQTKEETLEELKKLQPDLLLLDLSIPEKSGMEAETEIGVKLLKDLLQEQENLNIVVLSSNAKALVRIKSKINSYQGGFTVADKSSIQDLLKKVDWSLEGLTNTKNLPELQNGELEPEWYDLLKLANKGMTDEKIGEKMNVCTKTIGNYWTKIRDVLHIYPESGRENTHKKVRTLNKARELGYID